MHDIGLRPGEKLHEEMISPGGGPPRLMIMDGKYYVLEPELATWGYSPAHRRRARARGFPLASDKNDLWIARRRDPRDARGWYLT